MEESNSKALIAEAVGTFLLVLSIVMAVTLYKGVLPPNGQLPNLIIPFVAFAHGFALFVGIQTLGRISGGHFNPAVTLGLLAIGKIKGGLAGLYIVMQVIGATLAAFLVALVLNDQGQAVGFAAPTIDYGTAGAPGITLGAGILLEALFVFFLVWTIVATAVAEEGPKEWAPIAISTVLALGVLLIGPWTGASLNPARAFGPDLTNALFGAADGSGFGPFKDFILAYVIGPIAGGVLAATLYNALYIKKPVVSPPDEIPSEQSPI